MKELTISIVFTLLLISVVIMSIIYAIYNSGGNSGIYYNYSPFINDNDLRVLIKAI